MAVDRYYLRDNSTHGLTPSGDGAWKDLNLTRGGALSQFQVTSTAGGTEIQWTQLTGGVTQAWIGPAAGVGGYTLQSVAFNVWGFELAMTDNLGPRARLFKRAAAGTITELAGGPFDDGVEMGTASALITWNADPTDTDFAQNDRLLLRMYITNIGTMAAPGPGILAINGATPGADGDSWIDVTTAAIGGATAQPIRRRSNLQAVKRSAYY